MVYDENSLDTAGAYTMPKKTEYKSLTIFDPAIFY